MYDGDYSDTVPENQSLVSPISFNVHMFSIADKYDMPALSRIAAAKFQTRANAEWASTQFADAIADVYACAGADHYCVMRDIVLSVSIAHAQELLKGSSGIRFRETAKAVPDFGGELAIALVDGLIERPVDDEIVPENDLWGFRGKDKKSKKKKAAAYMEF